jgi:hypothetical protein
MNNPESKNLNWTALCGNPKARVILNEEYKKNPKSNNLNWTALCGNPKARVILNEEYKKNPKSNNLDWSALCGNPKADKILKNEGYYSDNIDWSALSGNTNPKAIELLKYNSKNINWNILSGNPSAIELIVERIKLVNKNKHDTTWINRNLSWDNSANLNWELLSANPSLFTINQNPLQLKEIEISINGPLKHWELTDIKKIREIENIKKIEILLNKQLIKRRDKDNNNEDIYEFV